MDSLGGGLANADLTKLSDREKQELQQFVVNESQKARIQSCQLRSPSLLRAYSSRILADMSSSDTLPYRHLLSQVHPRWQCQEREAG